MLWTYLFDTRRPRSWPEFGGKEPIVMEERRRLVEGRPRGAEALEGTDDVPGPPWCKDAAWTATATRSKK